MKALKNDSTIYTEQIVSAVTECYSKNPEPSNRELMKLYAFIGQNICEQGEKASPHAISAGCVIFTAPMKTALH